MLTLAKPFESHILIKAHDETPEGERHLYAPVHAADEPDMDGDILTKGGLIRGLATHQKLGAHVDYAHKYAQTFNPKWLVGNGLPDAPEIDGVPNLVTHLLKGKEIADEVWDHVFKKGIMGYSLQGVAIAHDPRNHKRVTDLAIKLMTVDPAPKSGSRTHLKMGNPTLGGLGALTKAFSSQIDEGNLSGWCTLDEDEAISFLADDTPAFGWSMSGLLKAMTVGADGPGAAAVAESLSGERQEDKAQHRCPACKTRNKYWRKECRHCACALID